MGRAIDREGLEKRKTIAKTANAQVGYTPNSLPPGVQRLLRHLKKARLEQVQHQGGDAALAGLARLGSGENLAARSGQLPTQSDFAGGA